MKMKKVLTTVLSLALVACLSIMGTIAYLTHEDSDANVMTMGNVEIEQIEKERVTQTNNGDDKIQDYTQEKPLYPIVGELKYADGLQAWPTGGANQLYDAETKNVQDKMVFVENTGKSPAYVRTLFAFEQGSLTSAEYEALIGIVINGTHWKWNDKLAYNVEIGDSVYAIKEAVYVGTDAVHTNGVLPAGETSRPSLLQVFMHSTGTNEDVEKIDGNKDGKYNILVLSQATQTNGFDNAEAALNEAFGTVTADYAAKVFGGVEIPTAVSDEGSLREALANGESVYLTDDITVDADSTIKISSGANTTINLNGHKLSGTAEGTKNREMFLVNGELTVENGDIELTATVNQGWNAMATIFDVTAGGVLNLDGVKANVSGTDMTFIVHLNNWGEVTLNVNDCELTSNYCAVRVFNSGTDMNNVTIRNSKLHGDNRAFWVHNYFGDNIKGTKEEIDARLNIDLINGTNTITNGTEENPKNNPIRYGFGNQSIYYDAEGNDVTIR